MRRHRGPPWPFMIAAIQVVGGLIAYFGHPDAHLAAAGLPLLLLLAGPFALSRRTRRPVVMIVTVCAAVAGWLALDLPAGPILPSLVVAVIWAVVHGHRYAAWASLAGLWLAWLGLGAADLRPMGTPLQELRGLGLVALLAAAAELIDNRRQRISAYRRLVTEERLRRREEEQRRASEERLRMARELHDILAHSLSLITVRASVALEVMQTHPDEVRPALLAIQQTSRDGLAEVRAVLAGLRSPEDPATAPRRPAPGLDRLDDLIADASAAGLTVTLTTGGDPAGVPAAVGLAAYRIVQEALTNVVRHSQARTAAVHVQYTAGTLVLGVRDEGPARPVAEASGGGNGLIGVRERAVALGGTATALPCGDGGFEVLAMLPTGGAPR